MYRYFYHLSEPVPVTKVDNVAAVPRPQASSQMLERQGSFRGFSKLSETSPFKRQLSLRMNELPSTLDRQKNMYSNGISNMNGPTGKTPGMKYQFCTFYWACESLGPYYQAISSCKFLSPPMLLHRRLLCITFCLSVHLSFCL